jgi:hypothetical protein
MGVNVAVTIDQITDGTSNTIMLGEIRAGVSAIDRRGVWAMSGAGSSSLWQHGTDDDIGPNACTTAAENIMGCQALIDSVGQNFLQK